MIQLEGPLIHQEKKTSMSSLISTPNSLKQNQSNASNDTSPSSTNDLKSHITNVTPPVLSGDFNDSILQHHHQQTHQKVQAPAQVVTPGTDETLHQLNQSSGNMSSPVIDPLHPKEHDDLEDAIQLTESSQKPNSSGPRTSEVGASGDRTLQSGTSGGKTLEQIPIHDSMLRRHTTNDLFKYKLHKKKEDNESIASQSQLTNTQGVPLHSSRSRPIKRLSFDNRLSIDSANTEISRTRNSILMKRTLTKKFPKFKSSVDEEHIVIGNKITEGHENYVMAYNMLTGIRVAVSRCSGVMKKLTDKDFSSYKKLTFNMDGSEMTPSSKYDFKFKDYCPEVFRDLRTQFGLDQADYLIGITGKYILSELGSPGKSGSFFYYSRDFRFIIKTVHHSEHKQLRRILKNYHSHVKQNPNTLVSQIYGLHRLKMPLTNGVKRKVHFIVMNNLFPPHRDIHCKYDLKGSTWGRYTIKDSQHNHIKPLKDLNWIEDHGTIKFGPKKREVFLKQLTKDVDFLKSVNVMDYSLLLGIHNTKQRSVTEHSQILSDGSQKLSIFDPKSDDKSDLIKTSPRFLTSNDLPTDVYPGRSKFIFYGHDGGIRSTNDNDEPGHEIYYLGVIDFLTNYSLRKRLETFWRSLSHKRESISAVPATEYGDRFVKFIKGCIPKPKQE